MKFKLSEEEHKKVKKMYHDAGETPSILVGGVDLASKAWADVAEYMDELGKQYHYDPKTAVISMDSLEFNADALCACGAKATHLFVGIGDTKVFACDEDATKIRRNPGYLIETDWP